MIPLKDDSPSRTTPFVTVALIVINAGVFAFQLALGAEAGERFVFTAGAVPYEITHLADVYPASIVPLPFTLFTSMFVHAGFFHIAGNMLYLWIFGDNIEDAFGHVFFVFFYLFAGAAAALTQVLFDPGSLTPMVGASGAVAGVLGAYFLLYPKGRVYTLVFLFLFVSVVKLPALLFLGLWFLMQVLGAGVGGGVAWWAHIGGFAAGVVVALFFRPRVRRMQAIKDQ